MEIALGIFTAGEVKIFVRVVRHVRLRVRVALGTPMPSEGLVATSQRADKEYRCNHSTWPGFCTHVVV